MIKELKLKIQEMFRGVPITETVIIVGSAIILASKLPNKFDSQLTGVVMVAAWMVFTSLLIISTRLNDIARKLSSTKERQTKK
ncbi:MAG: hypothetical protein CMI54_08735 [Parcubacteria group bacterium]|jgi:phosphatidylserine synthase|nr:hypothetical protein [Parcubacteria group bacterium]|tara:strand:+ start:2354 stop:2602 length:249 start_codon:yes stop_codon:yes gene_type:complete